MQSSSKTLFAASLIVLSLNVQDALAGNPFDGGWTLDESRIKQTEGTMRQSMKQGGVPDSAIPEMISAVVSLWRNIEIRDGKFRLSGEGRTSVCTINAAGIAGTISCDNGPGNKGTIRVNGSLLIVSPPGITFFFRKKYR